jgi:hypothetical protein
MTVEDQLRAAGRAVREQVSDLPPLDLGPQPSASHARVRAFRRRPGAGRWLIPMAAAAAVVAVAVTLVAVRDQPGVTPAASASAGPAASHSVRPAATAPANPEALPQYFVAVNGLSAPYLNPTRDSVIVGATLTGKRLATIAPPAGRTFAGVTGAADDRTFVLDAVPVATTPGRAPATMPRTWSLLRISPGSSTAPALTPLHLPVPSGADVNGISLSPDGTRLAVLYQVASTSDKGGFPYSGPFTVGIYAVATGATVRSWTGDDPVHGSYGYGTQGVPDANDTLTWTSDGQRLAFAYRNSKDASSSLYLRELNLAHPGGDLFADSTVIATIAASPSTGRSTIWCDTLGITGDGRSAVCGAELPRTPPVGATLDALTEPDPWTGCAAPTDVAYPGLARISLAGDKLAQVLYQVKPACMGGGMASVLWSSPSGGTVLGALMYTDDPSMTEHRAVVLYRHGRATTLTWTGATSLLLGYQVAF